MQKTSAGLLVYRKKNGSTEVCLVHPGGPFWKKKDAGAWSIPKGEYLAGEAPLAAALREFTEETGNVITAASFHPLQTVRLKSGKLISAWAVENDLKDPFISSNSFEMEWPPRSGKMQEFPEVDTARWLTLDEAREKIHPMQAVWLDELGEIA